VSWVFLVLRAVALGLAKSRCVHDSPAVSSCARTYSGQRPGRARGPPDRFSLAGPVIRGRAGGLPASGKTIGAGARWPANGPQHLPAARRPRQARDLAADSQGCAIQGSTAVISVSPARAALPPLVRDAGARPGGPARPASSAAGSRSVRICRRLMDLSSTFGGPGCTWRSGTDDGQRSNISVTSAFEPWIGDAESLAPGSGHRAL